MKKIKKMMLWVIVIILIISILVALIINILFKWHSNIFFIEAEWNAGDALSFFGSILSAIIGIIGIYVTTYISQEKYREDIKRSVLPVFSMSPVYRTFVDAFGLIFEEKKENKKKNEYREEKLNELFFELKSDGVRFFKSLSKKQTEILTQNGNVWNNISNDTLVLENRKTLSLLFDITNVGKGTAMNFRIGINPITTNIKDRKYTDPQSISASEFLRIMIFCIDACEADYDNYILELIYCDIYNNEYKQQYEVSVEEQSNNPILVVSTEFKQESIIK